jgi:hypothetical protein
MVLHAHTSPGGWTIGPLVTAVQRRSFTPLTWSSCRQPCTKPSKQLGKRLCIIKTQSICHTQYKRYNSRRWLNWSKYPLLHNGHIHMVRFSLCLMELRVHRNVPLTLNVTIVSKLTTYSSAVQALNLFVLGFVFEIQMYSYMLTCSNVNTYSHKRG